MKIKCYPDQVDSPEVDIRFCKYICPWSIVVMIGKRCQRFPEEFYQVRGIERTLE